MTSLWMPGVTKLYRELQERYFPTAGKDRATILSERDAVDILRDSPFMGFSINIGPHAVATLHRDSSNMLNGPCAIGVFGTFDGKRSGHVILHEAKTIIEVIPGDVIIILSSTITHENVPLCDEDKNKKRHSFVHYTAGGLFQWMWDGEKLHKDVKEKAIPGEGKKRFTEMYGLLPTINDLRNACSTGFLPDYNVLARIQNGQSFLLRPSNV